MQTDKPTLVKKEYSVPFILITSLFFLWGFARSILDVLNKHFQVSLNMSTTESTLIQVSVYSAYFLLAVPAGLYIKKKGYRAGVVLGLLIFGLGALLIIPSDMMLSFGAILVSLFVLACGLVFLETAANPYASELGDPRTAASRINLSQAFNGLGCILGPLIVGSILFSKDSTISLAVPYAVMGVLVLVVAWIFSRSKLPEIKLDNDPNAGKSILGLWKHSRFCLGIVALFFYEVAEISINSLFINYVTFDGWLDPEEATFALSTGALVLFFVGRLLGSFVMSRFNAENVLSICAFMTVLFSALIIADLGIFSRLSLFAIYFFESIMFPTVFAISLNGLGSYTKRASSFLMMTPIGGAIGTFMMALVVDHVSMSAAFVVPMVGYSVVMVFAYLAMAKKLK